MHTREEIITAVKESLTVNDAIQAQTVVLLDIRDLMLEMARLLHEPGPVPLDPAGKLVLDAIARRYGGRDADNSQD